MKKYNAFIHGEMKTISARTKADAFIQFSKLDDEITLGEIWQNGDLPKKWAASYVDDGKIIRAEVFAMTKVYAWRKIGVGKVRFSQIGRVY